MSRRWHTPDSRARLPELPSLFDFVSDLPPIVPAAVDRLADPSEVYSLYSALFAKGFNPEVHASGDQQLWYLLLQRSDKASTSLAGAAAAASAAGTAAHQDPGCDRAPAAAAAAPAAPHPGPPAGVWQEAIVPVSTSCPHLTPRQLQGVFKGLPPTFKYYKLALVDRDGTITITKVHGCIQSPEEKIMVADEG